jgi:hypothetical protein
MKSKLDPFSASIEKFDELYDSFYLDLGIGTSFGFRSAAKLANLSKIASSISMCSTSAMCCDQP